MKKFLVSLLLISGSIESNNIFARNKANIIFNGFVIIYGMICNKIIPVKKEQVLKMPPILNLKLAP